jgi:hypothetical protein
LNFQFFESLTAAEATEYLTEYLGSGRHWIAVSFPELDDTSPTLDLLVDAFQSLAETARLEPVGDPVEIVGEGASGPIRVQLGQPTEFDSHSRVAILNTSYLLGETVRRSSPSSLRWALGAPRTAEQMQPVVSGFRHGVELSTLLVAENLTRRVLRGLPARQVVVSTVARWAALVPSSP